MGRSEFQQRLRAEFEARKNKNARYSLRAFAAFLETDHSSLSQILREKRRIPIASIRAWGRKLGMTREEISAYTAAQHVPDAASLRREQQLRHWTAEALAIVTDRCHWRIVELARSRGFRPDCRWVAEQAGTTVDAINVALSRLLRLRLLEIAPQGNWKLHLGARNCDEEEFRRRALIRVRELAAEDGVRVDPPKLSER